MKENHVYFCGLTKNKQKVRSFQEVHFSVIVNKIAALGDSVALITNDNSMQNVYKWQTEYIPNSQQTQLFGVLQPLFNTKKFTIHVNDVHQLPDQLIVQTQSEETIIINNSAKSSLIFRQKVITIASGLDHCLALSSDAKVYAWGSNQYGVLGLGNNISFQETPVMIKSLLSKNISCIAAGSYHNVCCSASEVFVWGKGDDGALGLRNVKSSSEPLINNKIKALDIKKIGCGANHTTILTNSGSLISFGSNEFGQLGIDKPSKLSYDIGLITKIPSQIDDIWIGLYHCFAMTNNNCVFGWGLNKHGQLGVGDEQEIFMQPVQISIPFMISQGDQINFTSTQNSTYLLCVDSISKDLSEKSDRSNNRKSIYSSIKENRHPSISVFQRNSQSLVIQQKSPFRNKSTSVKNGQTSSNKRMEASANKIIETSGSKKIDDSNVSTHMWEQISNNWFTQKNEQRTQHLIQKGIPINFRKKIWRLTLPNRQSITKDLYESKLEEGIFFMGVVESLNLVQSKIKSLNLIDLDIARTYPEISLFRKGSPFKDSLRRVLIAFTIFRSDIGYIQGMSYIGGLFLMYFEEYECFVRFVSLITAPSLLPIFQMHEKQPQLIQKFVTFEKLLLFNLPIIANHFEDLGIHPSTYLVEWIMTLYTKTLNPDMTSRIWDLFFVKGVEILWRTAIAILALVQTEVLSDDLDQVYKCFRKINEFVTDEDLLVQTLISVKFPKDLEQEFVLNIVK